MSLQIIIKGKTTYGKTRSEQESNLRKDGLVSMDDTNYEKCKWLEKKIREKYGSEENYVRQNDLANVK